MRKEKTLSFEIGNVSVKELSVRQVLGMGENLRTIMDESSGLSDLNPLIKRVRELFDLSVVGIDWDKAQDLTPSELKELYEAWKEVNSVFFDVSRTLGLSEMIEAFLNSIKRDLSSLFVGLSSEDTPEP